MKLVFFSGGFEKDNFEINKKLLKMTSKKNPRITFIPADSFDGDADFMDFVESFKGLGNTKFLYFPVDISIDKIMLNEILKSDIIHLGGGNTYYFLNCLRRTKMLPKLKKFVKEGGILSGLSAGSIIMTKDIRSAGYPDFDSDENEDGIKNLSALDLVDFEFFPHFRNSRRYRSELLYQSTLIDRPIYAVPDGSGIVVDGGEKHFCGRVYVYENGKSNLIRN